MKNKKWYQKGENLFQVVLAILVPILTYFFTEVKLNFTNLSPENIKILLAMFNMVILIFLTISLSVYNYEINFRGSDDEEIENSKTKFMDIVLDSEIIKKRDADWYNFRVNLLTKQLCKNVIFYSLSLILVYACYLIDYNDKHQFHIPLKIAEDFFNLLSSLFIYVSFLVLYSWTVDENNKSNYLGSLYFHFVWIILLGYTIAYFIYFNRLTYEPSDFIANRFSLIAGIVNGFAMFLLFSRFIAMEFFAKYTTVIRVPIVIRWGILYLLPVYAVIQPLFGTFQIDAFGSHVKFTNIVFFICLIGKTFFAIVIFGFLKRKIIHLYLHVKLTQLNLVDRYEECFRV